MQDDFIQGIMFSRSSHMDLKKMSESERNLYKILALSHSPRGSRLRGPRVKPLKRGSSIKVGMPLDTVAPQIIKFKRQYLHDPHSPRTTRRYHSL